MTQSLTDKLRLQAKSRNPQIRMLLAYFDSLGVSWRQFQDVFVITTLESQHAMPVKVSKIPKMVRTKPYFLPVLLGFGTGDGVA